jgi:hypothetical protein
LTELVLFVVGNSENVVTDSLYGEYSDATEKTDILGVLCEIVGGVGVGEWNPKEVSNREHETETVGGNILSRRREMSVSALR